MAETIDFIPALADVPAGSEATGNAGRMAAIRLLARNYGERSQTGAEYPLSGHSRARTSAECQLWMRQLHDGRLHTTPTQPEATADSKQGVTRHTSYGKKSNNTFLTINPGSTS